MERIIFYREWLPLQKQEFRILAMLADLGEFRGNLSDLCRYFSLTPQSRNRNQLKASIEALQSLGFIETESCGRCLIIKAVPKEQKIEMPREWMELLKNHDYSSESVAWEQVLKVYLWISQNEAPIVTNDEIAAALNISTSTLGYAKNVLEYEYAAITRKKVSEKVGDNAFRTIGQELAAGAWWEKK